MDMKNTTILLIFLLCIIGLIAGIYYNEASESTNKGKIISKNLNKLRKMRNQVDYDKLISKPLSQMINDSEKLSKRILELLNELN